MDSYVFPSCFNTLSSSFMLMSSVLLVWLSFLLFFFLFFFLFFLVLLNDWREAFSCWWIHGNQRQAYLFSDRFRLLDLLYLLLLLLFFFLFFCDIIVIVSIQLRGLSINDQSIGCLLPLTRSNGLICLMGLPWTWSSSSESTTSSSDFSGAMADNCSFWSLFNALDDMTLRTRTRVPYMFNSDLVKNLTQQSNRHRLCIWIWIKSLASWFIAL